MANYNTPWNKDKGDSPEVKQQKRAVYYQRNKDKIIANGQKRYQEKISEIKEYNRWRSIKKKYGITRQQWQVMHDDQLGLCGICEKSKELNVDHCHETGKVRKLICDGCNIAMGVVDNEALLSKCKRYKDEFK